MTILINPDFPLSSAASCIDILTGERCRNRYIEFTEIEEQPLQHTELNMPCRSSPGMTTDITPILEIPLLTFIGLSSNIVS